MVATTVGVMPPRAIPENVTLTPHIAGAFDDVVAEHSRMAAEALRAWRAGEPVRAVANQRDLVASVSS